MRYRHKFKLSVLSLILFACSSAPIEYQKSALSEQIIRPHPGFAPLFVNRTRKSTKDEKTGVVTHGWDTATYDLRDRETRLRLRDLRFGCNVNGRLFRVAQEHPGLIRETYKRSCFLFICGERKLASEEILSVESDYQFLLDAKTICFNLEKYPFDFGG